MIKAARFLAPILANSGAEMARSRNIAAGVLMLLSCAALACAFGFNAFTMFPIGFSLLGEILALAARQPDSH